MSLVLDLIVLLHVLICTAQLDSLYTGTLHYIFVFTLNYRCQCKW